MMALITSDRGLELAATRIELTRLTTELESERLQRAQAESSASSADERRRKVKGPSQSTQQVQTTLRHNAPGQCRRGQF